MAGRKNRAKEQKLQKTLSIALLCAIAAILAITVYYALGGVPNTPQTPINRETMVHFIDVGQGDCVLLEQNGEFALIDAGDKQSSDAILKYLADKKVQGLKYVIMTHPHADHIGGMRTVIENYPVQKIILPNFEKYDYPTTSTFLNLIKTIKAKEIATETPVVGTEYPLGEGVVRVVGDGVKAKDFNNISLCTMFIGTELTYLSTGDGEKPCEDALLSMGQELCADIFKAGHHGSDTSNTAALLSAAAPKAVVISCGEGNDYGHPHKSVLDTFAAAGARVYRTDINGTVVAYANDDGSLQISTER